VSESSTAVTTSIGAAVHKKRPYSTWCSYVSGLDKVCAISHLPHFMNGMKHVGLFDLYKFHTNSCAICLSGNGHNSFTLSGVLLEPVDEF
jgi:hypothetical protein